MTVWLITVYVWDTIFLLFKFHKLLFLNTLTNYSYDTSVSTSLFVCVCLNATIMSRRKWFYIILSHRINFLG